MSTSRYLAITLALTACLAGSIQAQIIDGEIGNLNDPVPPSVPDILFGDQAVAYLVHPDEQVSCPDNGFRLETVQMYLEFTPEQVPTTLLVAGGLLEALEDDSSGSGFIPGDEVCYSGPQLITIVEPGLHEIEVHTFECGCLLIDQPYFLSLRFFGDAVANLVIDDEPAPGIEFLDSGNGWVDMNGFDRTSGGKVIIWGDIICCIVVETEATSWHQIKGLFR